MSGRIFITADTHFGHAEALGKFERPFPDVDAMDDALVAGINGVVAADDLLYHLGDFTGPLPKGVSKTDHAVSIRERLACRRIILVRGNHDPRNSPAFDDLFDSVHGLLSFRGWSGDGGGGDHRVVLCHYGLRVWQGRRDGSLHVHGHTHGTLPEVGRSTDVGVDCWNFRPQPLGEVLAMLEGREPGMPEVRSPIQPVRGN